METTSARFRAEIEHHLEVTGMDATAFGRVVMNDPRFVFDLRRGRSPSGDTMDKVWIWLKSHKLPVAS